MERVLMVTSLVIRSPPFALVVTAERFLNW